jgi:predicted MPP superfamily phosphohydrolase
VNPIFTALFALCIVIQGIVTYRVLVWLRERFSGGRLVGASVLTVVFGIAAMLAYLCSGSDLMSRVGIAGQTATVIGAGAYFYFFVAGCVLAVRSVLRFVGDRLGVETDVGRRRALNLAGNALVAAPFVVIGYGALIQRTNFRVREVDVPFPGLPQDLDGLRLLQLSDIHLGPFLSEAEFARVVDAAIELRPHIALVTGDLISSHDDPLAECIRQLSRLKADAGVFGCMGNHERYAGVEKITAQMAARAGIRFLRQEAQPLRFGRSLINLAGVDYQSLAGKQSYLRGAEKLIAPGAFNVLLSHNPDVFPVAAQQGYNLLLAGHTHGGQVTVEILDQSINPARFLTPFVYGLYRSGPAAEYVTRGIGTIGIPARIGAPPEVSVVRLRKA